MEFRRTAGVGSGNSGQFVGAPHGNQNSVLSNNRSAELGDTLVSQSRSSVVAISQVIGDVDLLGGLDTGIDSYRTALLQHITDSRGSFLVNVQPRVEQLINEIVVAAGELSVSTEAADGLSAENADRLKTSVALTQAFYDAIFKKHNVTDASNIAIAVIRCINELALQLEPSSRTGIKSNKLIRALERAAYGILNESKEGTREAARLLCKNIQTILADSPKRLDGIASVFTEGGMQWLRTNVTRTSDYAEGKAQMYMNNRALALDEMRNSIRYGSEGGSFTRMVRRTVLAGREAEFVALTEGATKDARKMLWQLFFAICALVYICFFGVPGFNKN